MKFVKVILIISVTTALLTACYQKYEVPEIVAEIQDGESIVKDSDVPVEKREYRYTKKGKTEGQFEICVKDMRIVDSTSDWEINPDGFDFGGGVILDGQSVSIEECLEEDKKHLKKGFTMLLVDMEAHNIDADNDIFITGNRKYIFRSDGFYLHLNPEHIQTINSTTYNMMVYYSGWGEVENESVWCFELKPGEKKTYTIGFFLDDNLKTGGYTGEIRLEDIYFNDMMSLLSNDAIQLSEVVEYDAAD